MDHPSEILVADRFPSLRLRLIELLSELSEEEWERPTAAGQWSVKDVCAHLLGGDVGILSRRRDGYLLAGPPIENYQQLVELINRLNVEWVTALRRASPRLLRELLAVTGPEVEAYFASLDLMAEGPAVSWAGPEDAPVWFDVAREFTERWHHQQQIRDATGRTPLYEPFFLAPVLDTFVRALPRNYRQVEASVGTVVQLTISGEAGGVWFPVKELDGWRLRLQSSSHISTEVVLPEDVAWRLFTKGLTKEQARSRAIVRGDEALAEPIFSTVAIIG